MNLLISRILYNIRLHHLSSRLKSNRLLYLVQLIISLLLIVASSIFQKYIADFQLILLFLIFAIVGLPHGSMDHIIHNDLKKNETKKSKFSNFIFSYYSKMLLFSIIWFFFPLLSFSLFIVMSAYHFGESQLSNYFNSNIHSLIKRLIYTFWGLDILCTLMILNLEETQLGIVELFTNFNTEHYLYIFISQNNLKIIIFLGIINILGLLYLWIKKNIENIDFSIELIILGILFLIFYYNSMLLGFAIYFGVWHSIKAIQQIFFFQQGKGVQFSIKKLYSLTFVYTLIGGTCISIILFASNYFNFFENYVLLFFILISILTLPHSLIFSKMNTVEPPIP